ncbi:MAG: archaeal heat shock protein Hsp14 [Candidatus Bathyarchaeia archaeon]
MTELVRQLSREVIKGLGDKSREVFELLSPAVDVVEDGPDLLIVADLPGFSKKDINVRVAGSVLTVSAEKESPEYTGPTYWLQRPLKVSRQIPLPIRVEEDIEVKGKYENGVLQVRIPLKGTARVKID